MSQHLPHMVLDALLVNQRPTGVGRSILELTQAMSQKPRGKKFTVLVTDPTLFTWLNNCPEWTVLHCPGASGGTLRKAFFTQFKIPALCRKLEADLFHSLQFVAPTSLNCPNVVTVHDLAWLSFPDTVEEPRKSYYRLLVPRTLKKAAAVVTNSEATAQDVRSFYPACRSVSVTPFGTPSWVWDQVEKPRPATPERPFFLFVGTLEPRKNLERIVEAFGKLLSRTPAQGLEQWPSLVLVGGKGWKDSNLQRMMTPLVQSGDISILDYCGLDKLRELYLMAQVLLFPSLHEGFGFPILEAMALELPVVTPNLGAMAEVAGQDALLVDPENVSEICDTMAQLASSSQLRKKISALGVARAKKWNWDVTAEATLAVYDEVLDP